MWQVIASYLVLSLSIFLVGAIVPGIRIRSFTTALFAGLIFGLLNVLFFKVFLFITFPLVLLKYMTLGLFGLVINAVLLLLTDKLVKGMEIAGFGSALLGGLGISVVHVLLRVLF